MNKRKAYLVALLLGTASLTAALPTAPASAATVTATISAVFPAYSASDTIATITGSVSPAVAGRSVSVNITDSAGANPTWKAGTTTDANGNYTVSFPTDYVRYYRIYSAAKTVGTTTYSAANSAVGQIKSLRLWEPFLYADTAEMQATGKWQLLATDYSGTGKVHNMSSWDAITMSHTEGYDHGAAVFSVLPGPTTPPQSAECPTCDGGPGYESPYIATTGTNSDVVYGHLEASIKFQRPQGAHGAVWMNSGTAVGAAETDTAEFFGRNNTAGANQKIQHSVHAGRGGTSYDTTCFNSYSASNSAAAKTPVVGHNGSGQVCGYKGVSASGFGGTDPDTWWKSYHTFESVWIASGTTFYVDGVNVGSVANTDTTMAPKVRLSLLVHDFELDNLQAHLAGTDGDPGSTNSLADYKMYVDWVRVWR